MTCYDGQCGSQCYSRDELEEYIQIIEKLFVVASRVYDQSILRESYVPKITSLGNQTGKKKLADAMKSTARESRVLARGFEIYRSFRSVERSRNVRMSSIW